MDRLSCFNIVEFQASKGLRYRLEWKDGRIAEDYQGYGTKKKENLYNRASSIIRELRVKFCKDNSSILEGVTSSKDVEIRLCEGGISLPDYLTPLMVFREVSGANKRYDSTKIYYKNGYKCVKTYKPDGTVEIDKYGPDGYHYEAYYPDGSMDIDGNWIG